MCELVWVLKRGYKYTKPQIINAIRQVIFTQEFAFENNKALLFALEEYQHNNLNFSDILIGKLNKHYSCKTTITLDHDTIKSSDFTDAVTYK